MAARARRLCVAVLLLARPSSPQTFNVLNYTRQAPHPQRLRTVTTSSAEWTDPGAECLDVDGNPLTWTHTYSFTGPLYLNTAQQLTVTYSCPASGLPSVTRELQIRDALLLNGASAVTVLESAGAAWTDPGADCIATNGYDVAPTTSYGAWSSDLSSPGIWTVTYSCKAADDPSPFTLSRVVQVVPPLRLEGDNPMTVWATGQDWTEPVSTYGHVCYDDSGNIMASLELPVPRRFTLDPPVYPATETTQTLTYSCRRRVTPSPDPPDVIRTVIVRDAIRVTGLGAPGASPREVLRENDFGAPGTFDTLYGVDAIAQTGVDCTSSIVANPPQLPTTAAGTFTVTYSCNPLITPNCGTHTATRTIVVRPALRINGPDPKIILLAGLFGAPSVWADSGDADCKDENFDSLTYVTNPTSINRANEGVHSVTYTCTDNSLRSVQEVRQVQVQNAITFAGGNPQQMSVLNSGTWSSDAFECKRPYPMDSDNLVTIAQVVHSPGNGIISLTNVGDYDVIYTCTDPTDGAIETVTRVLNIRSHFTLQGSNPQIALRAQHTFWVDPGALCYTNNGNLASWTKTPDMIELANVATHTVTYSCTRNSITLVEQRRLVVTLGGLLAPSLRGPSSMSLAFGETFAEPSACCFDATGQLLGLPTILGTINVFSYGPSTRIYQCTSITSVQETVQRTVNINRRPTVTLNGVSPTIAIPGSAYVDQGAMCNDNEDGLIEERYRGTRGKQNIVRVGALDITSGDALSVFDGDKADSSTRTQASGQCPSCVTATLLWLDLGVAREVSGIECFNCNIPRSAELRIADTIITSSSAANSHGFTCGLDTTSPIAGQTISCSRPVVGRIVILRSSTGTAMTICEIEVWGWPAPTPPKEFVVTPDNTNCPSVRTGLFKGEAQDVTQGVVYKYWAGTAWGTETIRRVQGASATDARWVLRDGSGNEQASVPSLSFIPPSDGWTVTSASSGTCQTLTLRTQPQDTCSWLFGWRGADTSADHLCHDGTVCTTDGCCQPRGSIRKCPGNRKWMCANMACSSDYCCKASESDCNSLGGLRQCSQTIRAATLAADTATYSSTGSTPTVIGARIEVVSMVDTSIAGSWNVLYICFDTSGELHAISRTVDVSCESPGGPNPQYSGNDISCTTLMSTSTFSDISLCAQACLADTTCEGYVWIIPSSKCNKKSGCTGKYSQDVSGDPQEAAICRRTDKPPNIILGAAVPYVLQSQTWNDGVCSCVDAEDTSNPPLCARPSLDTSTPGIFQVTYSCTDSANNVATSIRTVTVQANCNPPTANNDHPDGFCQESTDPIPRGGTCTLQCATIGSDVYQPNFGTLVCTSDQDTNPSSHWAQNAHGAPETPLCGIDSCNEPSVDNAMTQVYTNPSLNMHNAILQTPCVESVANADRDAPGKVSQNSYCTTNCKPGYRTRHARIQCVSGGFTPVTTFACELPATEPLGLFGGSLRYVDMQIGWNAGVPNDCVFDGWEVQGRRLNGEQGIPGNGATVQDFHAIAGCQPLDTLNAGRTKVDCDAVGLHEGGTYIFRVRETCTNDVLNSPWLEDTNQYTLSFVWPPGILLQTPTGSIKSNPGQVLLAVTQRVIQGLPTGGSIHLQRISSTHCLPVSFSAPADQVVLGQPVENQVGLVNGQIFLVLPDASFFLAGCVYSVDFEAGSMQTELVGATRKTNARISWTFTYIDEIPVLSLLQDIEQIVTKTGIRTTFSVKYHLASLISCTVSRSNIDGTLSDPVTFSNLQQERNSDVVNFHADSQTPDQKFSVTCTGNKRNRPHITLEPHTPHVYTTMIDTTIDIEPMVIGKFAICSQQTYVNGVLATVHEVVSPSQKTAAQLPLGDVLLIKSYEKFCNGDVPLTTGQQATMRIDMSVNAWSSHATIPAWTSSLQFFFTKPMSVQPQTASFRVCPHARNKDPMIPCHEYRLEISMMDLAMEVTGILPSRRLQAIVRPGPNPGSEHINMTSGGSLQLTVSASNSNVWPDITITLGSASDGFAQPFTYSAPTITIASVEGAGIYLPLIFAWNGVQFDMNVFISFRAPTVSLNPFVAPLNVGFALVQVTLTGVPTVARTGTNAKARDYLALKIVKDGLDDQLCSATTFDSAGIGWSQATCTVQPTIAAPLVLQLMMKDYNQKQWWTSTEVNVRNTVAFQPPDLTYIETLDKHGVASALARLDVVPATTTTGTRLTAMINIHGTNLPHPNKVRKTGASLTGYQLYLLPALGRTLNGALAPNIAVCSSLTYVSTVKLECFVHDCLDVRALDFQPDMVLQLGDLQSDRNKGQSLVRLPRPIVNTYSPASSYDVGNYDFSFTGTYFGIPCASNDAFCNNACVAWRAAGRPGTGAVQIFASAVIVVGIASCVVRVQNDTGVTCSTTGALRLPRAAATVGQTLGTIQITYRARILFNVGAGAGMMPVLQMIVDTTLKQCNPGEQRIREDSHICEPCIKGRYSTVLSPQFPLQCSWCGSSGYNDQVGSTGCLTCPTNTVSGLPRDDISRCTCLPGYYSQFIDAFGIAALPGTPCISCSTTDMTDEPPAGKRCSEQIINVPLCTVPSTDVCAPPDPSSYNYRRCKVSCAGGTTWPSAKPGYFLTGNDKLVSSNASTAQQYKPILVDCVPPVSCSAGNVCAAGYAEFGCVSCQAPPLKPYYKDKMTELCLPCGEEQVVGIVLMAAFGVMASLGAFAASILYMKWLCDPMFKTMVDELVKEKFAKPVLAFVKSTGLSELNKFRVRVVFTAAELLPSRAWITRKDLGLILRVAVEERRVYVAGVRENTPAKSGGIQANWRLVLINGQSVKASSPEEVQSQIAVAKIPITLTFRAPPGTDSKEDYSNEDAAEGAAEGTSTAASGMRMMTMTLGVAQSFKGIMALKLDWPPFFIKISNIFQNLLLNFDFFHPECSVAAPYWERWLAFALIPYAMIIPLSFAMLCLRVYNMVTSESHRKDLDFVYIQDWMLRNAWARTVLVCMIFFTSFEFELLIQPYSCIEREPGKYVMRDDQATICEMGNTSYRIIFWISLFMWAVVVCGISALAYFLRKGFYWQVGVSIRDELPFYIAMLEASTSDMKGYKLEVRERIYSNIVAVKMFPVHLELMNFRERLGPAIEEMGPRSRWVNRDVIKDTQGEQEIDTLETRRAIIMAKDRFHKQLKWTEHLDGNPLTYGWILLVNTFSRQLALMLFVVFSSSFPPFGAAGQSLVFIVNFLMIASQQPYDADVLNFQEALLVGCMGALTFMATFKELLSQHQKAPDYPKTINNCSLLIDILVLCIVLIIGSVIGLNVLLLVSRVVTQEDASALLNRVHYERIIAFEEGQARLQSLAAKKDVLNARDLNFSGFLLMDIKQLESQCRADQWPVFRQGANAILHLFNQTLLLDGQDQSLLDDDHMEMYGLRPTTEHMTRRRGSGVFTDMFSKALSETAALYARKRGGNARSLPFQGLCAMVVAWMTQQVGEKKLRLKLKSSKARERARTRKMLEQRIAYLIKRVIKESGKGTLTSWQDEAVSGGNSRLELLGPDWQQNVLQDLDFDTVLEEGGEFTNWDDLLNGTEDETNWWDDVMGVADDELGPRASDRVSLAWPMPFGGMSPPADSEKSGSQVKDARDRKPSQRVEKSSTSRKVAHKRSSEQSASTELLGPGTDRGSNQPVERSPTPKRVTIDGEPERSATTELIGPGLDRGSSQLVERPHTPKKVSINGNPERISTSDLIGPGADPPSKVRPTHWSDVTLGPKWSDKSQSLQGEGFDDIGPGMEDERQPILDGSSDLGRFGLVGPGLTQDWDDGLDLLGPTLSDENPISFSEIGPSSKESFSEIGPTEEHSTSFTAIGPANSYGTNSDLISGDMLKPSTTVTPSTPRRPNTPTEQVDSGTNKDRTTTRPKPAGKRLAKAPGKAAAKLPKAKPKAGANDAKGEDGKRRSEAATTIQKVFRGSQDRKETSAMQAKLNSKSSSKSAPASGAKKDEQGKAEAAVRIQKTFRGHSVRTKTFGGQGNLKKGQGSQKKAR